MPARTGKQVVIAVFPDPPPIPAETLNTATLVIEEVVGTAPPYEWRLVHDAKPMLGWNPSWYMSDEGATDRVFHHVRQLQDGTADDPKDAKTAASLAHLEAFVEAHPDDRDDMINALDELVHELMSQQAAAINNEGPSSQLTFLLDSGLSEEGIMYELRDGRLTYKVAVYFRGVDNLWHPHGEWDGLADTPEEARTKALDALVDERIDDWRAEVIGHKPDEEE